MPEPAFRLKTQKGSAIRVGGLALVPVARSVALHAPGVPAALLWSGPAEVRVQTPEGREHRLPVTDVTRRAQWTLLGLGLAGSLLIWLAFRRKSHG